MISKDEGGLNNQNITDNNHGTRRRKLKLLLLVRTMTTIVYRSGDNDVKEQKTKSLEVV